MKIAEKLIQRALDIDSTKADLLDILYQYINNSDKEVKALLGTISEEDINDVRLLEINNMSDVNDVEYEKKGDTIKVNNIQKSKKIVELYVKEATKEEARYFADLYYQVQRFRISVENQIRAIDQGYDQDDKSHKDDKQKKKKNIVATPATMTFRHHIANQLKTMEDDIKKCLSDYSDRMPMGRYAKATVGIGPVFATLLCSSLDIPDVDTLPVTGRQYTVGNWISYVGLNDNNRPWIKEDAKAKNFVEKAIKENGGVIDEEAVRLLCTYTHWNYDHYYKFCCNRKTGEFEGFTKDKLVKGTKMIPYNKDLKKTMFLIGQSFQIVSNKPNSLYGRLYKERYQYELNRNESGGNAEQAAMYLSEKNYGKTTEAYKAYSIGKLPKKQLTRRAMRHTVKIFLNHLFDFAYMEKYNNPAPIPYVFTLDGEHKDYIPAEVDPFEFLTHPTKELREKFNNRHLLNKSDN